MIWTCLSSSKTAPSRPGSPFSQNTNLWIEKWDFSLSIKEVKERSRRAYDQNGTYLWRWNPLYLRILECRTNGHDCGSPHEQRLQHSLSCYSQFYKNTSENDWNCAVRCPSASGRREWLQGSIMITWMIYWVKNWTNLAKNESSSKHLATVRRRHCRTFEHYCVPCMTQ